MATETLFANADDNGWPTGDIVDIDEGVAAADGSVMSTTIDDDVLRIDFASTSIADADTVTQVDVRIRGRTTGSSGKDTLGVDFLIGGAVQGTEAATAILTGSHANYTLNDAGWNSDWTAAQIGGAQVDIYARQTGKATAATWEVDAVELIITYTPAPASGPFLPYHTKRFNVLLRM